MLGQLFLKPNLTWSSILIDSKTQELEDLQGDYASITQELQDMHSAHQRTVEELRCENEGSLRKLRETAEQFEWLCEQQRVWMCGFKRWGHMATLAPQEAL